MRRRSRGMGHVAGAEAGGDAAWQEDTFPVEAACVNSGRWPSFWILGALPVLCDAGFVPAAPTLPDCTPNWRGRSSGWPSWADHRYIMNRYKKKRKIPAPSSTGPSMSFCIILVAVEYYTGVQVWKDFRKTGSGGERQRRPVPVPSLFWQAEPPVKSRITERPWSSDFRAARL